MGTRLFTIGRIVKHFRMVPFLSILYFFFNASVSNAQFFEAGVGKLKVPVEAPDFTLKELNGGEVSLKALKGKVVILNFFGTR